MAAFPDASPTNNVAALSGLINTSISAGYTPSTGLDATGISYAILRNLLTSLPAGIVGGTESVTAAGALSATKSVSILTGPAASTYAVTLAAPATAGIVKTITMVSTTSTNAVTMALTNVVGGSAASSASFDAAGETLILISNGGSSPKWVVLKEYGVTLS